MISLGKLSAGLAHELNNPASAIERSAALLVERLEDAELATRALGAVAADRCPARGHRRGAGGLPGHAGARRAVARSSRPNARRPSPTGSRITGSTRPSPDRLPRPPSRSKRSTRLPRRSRDRRSTRSCAGRPPAARCAASRRRSRTPRRASPAWSLAIKGFTHMDQAHGGRAGGPGVEPGQHGRRAQVEGAREVGRRGGGGRARSSARARLRRRTEPDLGQPDRQRPGRRPRRRPRRGDGAPRAAARRGARRRQRRRAFRPRSAAHLSSRSSPPSRSGRAPAWASTSSGGWSATTTATSTSSRSRAARSSASPCRLPTPTALEERS